MPSFLVLLVFVTISKINKFFCRSTKKINDLDFQTINRSLQNKQSTILAFGIRFESVDLTLYVPKIVSTG